MAKALLMLKPVKNKEEAYEKTIEMNGNNDYTTGNLLSLFQKYLF